MDNHEGEEDENSGHKIHQYLQHQDQDVKSGQSFVLIFVPFLTLQWHYFFFILNLILTMETVMVMKESNIEKVLYVTSPSRFKSSARKSSRISGRL